MQGPTPRLAKTQEKTHQLRYGASTWTDGIRTTTRLCHCLQVEPFGMQYSGVQRIGASLSHELRLSAQTVLEKFCCPQSNGTASRQLGVAMPPSVFMRLHTDAEAFRKGMVKKPGRHQAAQETYHADARKDSRELMLLKTSQSVTLTMG